jgi:AcrR family transcriptional regulator
MLTAVNPLQLTTVNARLSTALEPSPRANNARGQGEQLRDELLAAAADLMSTRHMVQIPSLRAVARAAGVSPTAVYLHFSSAAELASTAIATLLEDLTADVVSAEHAVAPGASALDRIVADAQATARWALRRPGAYQAMYETAELLNDLAGPHPHDPTLTDHVTDLLVDHGHNRDDAERISLRIWAGLHGLISLRIHKGDSLWLESLDTDIDAVVSALAGPSNKPKRG